MTVTRTIVITDPVHQVMSLGAGDSTRLLLKSVIDTSTFQRLRRISQLALAQNVFPGATHTRFVHGLGAAFLASRALGHLRERYSSDEIRDASREVIVAALLHDVGHGPFSHSFEQIFPRPGLGEMLPLHEDWTRAAIELEESDIHRALVANGVDVAKVSTAFQKDPDTGPLPKYLRQIVSSQLDVDRMDYLVRDSHFAGVALGRVDIYYLIHCLTKIDHDGGALCSLGLEEKGVKAYEGFALARQLMNRTVYFHKAVKLFEFMMEELLRQVVRDVDKLKTVAECREFIPSYLESVSTIGHSPPESKQKFMESNWKQYFAMTEPDIWSLVASLARSTAGGVPKRLQSLARMILTRQKLPYWVVRGGMAPVLREKLASDGFGSGKEFALVRFATTVYKQEKDPIFVAVGQTGVSEISRYSDILGMLRDREESTTLLVSLDEGRADALYQSGRSVQALPEDR